MSYALGFAVLRALRSNRGSNVLRTRQGTGDPNGIRTRVTAVKGRCPNRWTIGSETARKDGAKGDGGQGGIFFRFFGQNIGNPFAAQYGFCVLPTRHLIVKTLSVLTAVAAWPFFQAAAEVAEIPHGEYLELHACDLFTGGCTASAQITLGGRSLVRVWNFEAGDLAGLTVVVLETAGENLSLPGSSAESTMVYLPEQASGAQRHTG